MAVRSITDFGTSARIYRHHDGMPAVAGDELLRFLELDQCELMRTGSQLDEPSYLAARWVAYLGHRFRSQDGPVTDFLSVGIIGFEKHWGAEYHYLVDGDGKVLYRKAVDMSAHGELRWGSWFDLTRELVDRHMAIARNENPELVL